MPRCRQGTRHAVVVSLLLLGLTRGAAAGVSDSLAAGASGSKASADSARAFGIPRDTLRLVRTLEPTLVRASRLEVLSSETRQRVTREQLRLLPLDRVGDALALQPGVVVDGEIVHVRGARPGELRVEMDGIALNEPFRGEAFELPLVALEEIELIRGGLEADRGGGLAGTLVARPAVATEHWRGRALWQTDGRHGTHDDRVGARLAGPLPGTAIGISLGGEARLDDTHSPNLRTLQRSRILGGSFGWRASNQLTALARLAPVRDPGRVALQAMVSRRLLRPFNPMFSLVGWVSPCPDDSCLQGPAYSPTPVSGQRFTPYNAADHVPVTDVQRTALIFSTRRSGRNDRLSAALGWNLERRITSIDGRDDEAALAAGGRAAFGLVENATSDPFHAYSGGVPYFRKTRAEWIEARTDWRHERADGSALGAGLGATHEWVRFREVDFAYVPAAFDSFRVFTASAPGAYGWLSGRWVSEGLIVNGGVRAEWFSPGPGAEQTLHVDPVHPILSFSPRVGFSFPLSPRDAMQASYARIVQAPGREYLYDSRTARIVPRHPLGNPALEPSTAISWEFSLKHLAGEHWSGRAGLFYRDLFRQVSARLAALPGAGCLACGQPALRYASDDAGHASGFELAVERDAPGRSHLSATYTYMRTEGSESFEDGLPFYPLRLPQPPPIAEHPLAWDQPHRVTLSGFWIGRFGSGSWNTVIASGLPWTPAARRRATTDLSGTHSRSLPAFSLSDLSLRGNMPHRWGGLSLGLEVRNLFDQRGARRVSIDGYPNPVINTQFDDYAAHRQETGQGGGAYWNDANGDGVPGWVRVADPRLDFTPRVVRLGIGREW